MISHDRHFLNSVCTHTADIDYQTIITYTGGYDDMVLAKTQIRSRMESQNAQREKKIAQLNEFIARFSAGTRSSQVTSRKKEVERLQTSDLARSNIARPFIRFEMKRPSGRHALEIKGLTKSYGDAAGDQGFHGQRFARREDRHDRAQRRGQDDAAAVADRESRPARATTSRFRSTAASVEWGHEVQVGYFAQDHRATIQPGLTVLDWLQQFDPTAGNEELRGLLGQMLFTRDEGMKPTEALSGGEAARLIFCRLMLQKPNVLVLDEPTNHLDLESINALNIALQKYRGHAVPGHARSRSAGRRPPRASGTSSAKGIEDFKGAYEEYQAAVA